MLRRSENKQPLLLVENLEKRYERSNGIASRPDMAALCGVSLLILPRTTLALVGESGSGKSTLAMCVACLEKPTSGKIWIDDREITWLRKEELRSVGAQVQLVFQDPASSLNPRWSALEIVSEPLMVQRRFDSRARRERTYMLLERVGIASEKAGQRPHEFSGGQRQRLAIARALALEPQLLILDEALSALDCSVQAQIVNLLLELQTSLGLTYLFITHDLAMAAHLSDQIAVLAQGKIVETGPTEDMVRAPKHTVTQRLIAAARGSQNLPYKLKVV
jgi:ABC-type glutathione transport system ATPase component